jgi:hypothetical protein
MRGMRWRRRKVVAMKKTPFKPRTTPMSRGTSTLKQKKPMARGTSTLARSTKPMKVSKPKMTPIRKSAKGQDCLIQIPGVGFHDPATVVWCHSNEYQHGKGMGLKANDEFGAFGCVTCHAIYDRQAPRPEGMSKEDIDELFANAMEKSRALLEMMNLLEK